MPPVFRALPWAIPSLAVALAAIGDIIPASLASALILALPIAMLAVAPRATCRKG